MFVEKLGQLANSVVGKTVKREAAEVAPRMTGEVLSLASRSLRSAEDDAIRGLLSKLTPEQSLAEAGRVLSSDRALKVAIHAQEKGLPTVAEAAVLRAGDLHGALNQEVTAQVAERLGLTAAADTTRWHLNALISAEKDLVPGLAAKLRAAADPHQMVEIARQTPGAVRHLDAPLSDAAGVNAMSPISNLAYAAEWVKGLRARFGKFNF